MGMRAFVRLAAAAAITVLTTCATDSSSQPTSDTAVDVTPGDQTTTSPSGSAQVMPSTTAIDAIVTAAGGGGLIDSVEVTALTAVGNPAVGQPWLTFELVLDYCCGEPNSVVFQPSADDFDIPIGDPPALRLEGPACSAQLACTSPDRILGLTAPGPVGLTFGLTPLVDAADLLRTGSFSTELTPTFDFAHPGLDDAVMSIDLRVDLRPHLPAPTGDTTPASTASTPVTTVGGGFQLLTFPFAAVADDAQQLTTILAPASEPVDAGTLGIDWNTQVAIVITSPTDACPPLLAGLDVADRRAEPVFVGAGYHTCIQPLLSHTIIASVDRSELADVDELALPAEPGYFETPVSTPVDIAPRAAAPAPQPPAVPPFGDLRGSVALPARGEAALTTLTNGTPVFVVRHHDDTISALDPRAATDDIGNETDSQFQLVTWTAATRIFLGGGAWDEYGRRLDGFRNTDLQGFATRINGDVIEIGSPVQAPVGSPITAASDPPAMSNATIPLKDPIGLDQALAQPAGTTALIDATVIIDPDGAHICMVESQGFPIEPCPPGSPSADNITAQPDARNAWFGPLLATRTDTGFTRIAPTGGYAGGVL